MSWNHVQKFWNSWSPMNLYFNKFTSNSDSQQNLSSTVLKVNSTKSWLLKEWPLHTENKLFKRMSYKWHKKSYIWLPFISTIFSKDSPFFIAFFICFWILSLVVWLLILEWILATQIYQVITPEICKCYPIWKMIFTGVIKSGS